MIAMVQKMGGTLLACLSLLFIPALTADECCSTGCPDSCHTIGDAVWVGAEFLFWRPYFSEQEWAVVTTTETQSTPNSSFEAVEFDNQFYQNAWEPGFRVRAGVDQFASCLDLSFSYTWIEGKDRKNLHTPGSFLDLATSTDHFRYQTFDLLIHRTCALNCCHIITPYFGLQGLKFDQWVDTVKTSSGSTANDKIRVDGWEEALGLKFGAHYDWRIYNCLSFFFDGSFSILGGGQDLKQQEITFFNSLNTSNVTHHDNTSVCIPGFHIQTGLTFHGCFCSTAYYLTLGYEFLDWFNIQQVRRGLTDNGQIGIFNSQLGQRVGFQGLFVGAGFQF